MLKQELPSNQLLANKETYINTWRVNLKVYLHRRKAEAKMKKSKKSENDQRLFDRHQPKFPQSLLSWLGVNEPLDSSL